MHTEGFRIGYSMQKACANIALLGATGSAGVTVKFHSKGACLVCIHAYNGYTHKLLGNAVREECTTKVADLEEEFGRRR